MENKGHSSTQRVPQKLKIFTNYPQAIKKFLKEDGPYEIIFSQDSKQEIFFFVDKEKKHFDFQLHFSSKGPFRHLNLPLTKRNIKTVVDHFFTPIHKDLEQKDTISEKKNKNSIQSHRKKIKNINKLIEQIKKKNLTTRDINSFLSRNELFILLSNKLNSIQDFPNTLLNLKTFKGYESCQLLIHEKGKPTVDNFIFTKHHGLSSSKDPVKNFNSIYNIIKKSKNKLFDQSQILQSDLRILGTFLAKEFYLKTHNIIFIISRHDFLLPSQNELDYFNQIAELLSPIFTALLLKDKVETKIKIFELLFKNLPWPLAIADKKNKIIFQNQLFIKEKPTGPNLELKNKIIELSFENKLISLHDKNEFIATDIYHFQRVILLGELLNTLQHELSNPLFGLKLTSDLFADEIENHEIKQILAGISHSSDRCQTIIKNFSLLYQGENTYSEVDIKKLIKEASTLTKSETKGIQKEIIYMEDISKKDYYLFTNPTWLTQIIFNFIINSAQAIKTLQEALRNHKISIICKGIGRYKILISIADTGPGIRNEHSNKIFSPFFTTKINGTGLGLTICNNLAKKLNAKIFFKNNDPLPGATFSLELPIKSN